MRVSILLILCFFLNTSSLFATTEIVKSSPNENAAITTNVDSAVESQNAVSNSTVAKKNEQPTIKANHESGLVAVILQITLLGSIWVLWLLIVCSIISVTIILERILFFRKENIDFSRFITDVAALLNDDNLDGLKAYCKRKRGIESKMLLVGLSNIAKGPTAVERSLTGYVAWTKHRYDRGLMFLGTLGNNAPFIGLFGTVLGIIQAFHDLAQNPAGGATVVMSGISEALVATAVGLFVAIPAVVAYNSFQRIVKRRLSNAESIQNLILTFLNDERKINKKDTAEHSESSIKAKEA